MRWMGVHDETCTAGSQAARRETLVVASLVAAALLAALAAALVAAALAAAAALVAAAVLYGGALRTCSYCMLPSASHTLMRPSRAPVKR